MLCLPLILSAFIHLWNPVGFPYIVGDEGHYIRRALVFMNQLDPQEGARYDHPYFGQLFLAGIFKIIGYPDLVNPVPGNVYSTENLYAIPRIIMGSVAVLDTFIIYKICERLYTRNNRIAFIASILFAVMPLTWLTRRVYLDSIQLPFILLSILFALYYYKTGKTYDSVNLGALRGIGQFLDKKSIMIVLSGIMLGIAIFTKIPAVTMLPAIGYLVFMTNKKYNQKITNLVLWLIPIFVITAIWPAYAISVGEYDNWYSGVFSQAARGGSGIGSIEILFKLDPVLVSIGVIGFVFAILIKRDLILFLWIIPFLVFHALVPWTQHFHWLQLLPAFCISGAILIEGGTNLLTRRWTLRSHNIIEYFSHKGISMKREGSVRSIIGLLYRQYMKVINSFSSTRILAIIVIIIGLFGLTSTSILITTNVNSSFLEMVTFISQSLPKYNDPDNDSYKKQSGKGLCFWCSGALNKYVGVGQNNNREEMNKDNKVTMIGNHWIFGTFWIPKYVYGNDHEFKGFFTKGSVDTDKVLIVADSRLLDAISSEDLDRHLKELKSLYDHSTISATFVENRTYYDENIYPYQSMSENRGIGKIEVKKNY